METSADITITEMATKPGINSNYKLTLDPIIMSSATTYIPPNNLLQFVSVRLEGPSYLNWSSQVEDALNIHDLL
ncbi:hypothetical protein SADUNF_Sadunf02G0145500 [Salix dunnii]|uniref:Retrotransposon Copia-like N-terminal domain-containing protein n=1 Tax=Salix dunnii TaxID=1413687 RepID=A0A835N7X3_9ROSI|nr:hypothetical protein SADUNF_Sadunf02G0145500 [Salix dunnii]